MKFYKLKTSQTLVGTKADAEKSGEEYEEFHIETDKDSLMELYNGFVNESVPKSTMTEGAAVQIVSENDDGKSNMDAAIQLILNCGLTSLSRLAMAVSTRYAELSKRRGR